MEQIGIDFQGWPVNAMTLREIIDELGITYTLDNGDEIIRNDKKHLLDAYPVVLEDDGMGYGVNPKYIIEANDSVYEDKNSNQQSFNIFIQSKELTCE
jgi:hypothetical protein